MPDNNDHDEWRRRKQEQWWELKKAEWSWPPEWPDPGPGCLVAIAVLILIGLFICR